MTNIQIPEYITIDGVKYEIDPKDIKKSANPNKWVTVYNKYNIKQVDKLPTGRFPVEYDKVALRMLEQQFEKAYMRFPSLQKRYAYFIDKGIYKADILRGEVTADDLDEIYAEYDKYDIGERTMYGFLTFVMSQAIRLVDEEVKDNGSKEQMKYGYKKPKVLYDDRYVLMESRKDRVIAYSLDAKAHLGKEAVMANVRYLAQRAFSPSTPTVTNGGYNSAGQLTSCFILKYDDNMFSIGDIYKQTLELSKIGGGLGFDLTDIRALGEMVGRLDNRSHGTVAISKMLEIALRFADQDGKRAGSGAVYLDVFHQDILYLLDTKKENTDETLRLSDLSIGIIYRNKFFNEIHEKGYYYAFAPHTIFKEYGVKLSDINMDKMYDKLVANPRVRKKRIERDEILDMIGAVTGESGYPYSFMRENVNDAHIFEGITVYTSNLCTEILQRQDYYGEYHKKPNGEYIYDKNGERYPRRYGVQCSLSSLNMEYGLQSMKENTFEDLCYTMVEHQNGVIDRTNLDVSYDIEKAKNDFRAMALGLAGGHAILSNHRIAYGSEESLDFINVFGTMYRYYVLKASNKLVKRYGKFKDFEKSTYATGKELQKYVDKSFAPQTEKVKEIFKDVHIPTQEEWCTLQKKIMLEGLANAYHLAVAPTNSISYNLGTTQSVMPITQKIENRKTGSSGSAYYAVPHLDKPYTYMYYQEAYNIDDFAMMDFIATLQQHIEQGISTTIFITDEYTTADWWERVEYAWAIGLKTLYYARPKISGFKECLDCQ